MASADMEVTVYFDEQQLAALATWMGHVEACLAGILDPSGHPECRQQARRELADAQAARGRLSVSGERRARVAV